MSSVVWHVIVVASVVTCIASTAKNVNALVVLFDLDTLGSLTLVDVNVSDIGGGNIGRGETISKNDGLWEWLDIRQS